MVNTACPSGLLPAPAILLREPSRGPRLIENRGLAPTPRGCQQTSVNAANTLILLAC